MASAKSVAAERGLGWWSDAWRLFARSALLWVALGVILFLGLVVVSLVPLLGTLASALAMPVLGGSWMLAARKVEQGGSLEVADLFSAFKEPHLQPLLVLGALLLAATLVIGVMAGAIGLGGVSAMMAGGMHGRGGGAGSMLAVMGAGMAALLVLLVLGLLVTMALWFAIPLVVFDRVPPVESLRLSFAAVLKNALAFLVYGAIQLVLSLVASIPFGLGWLVLLPVTLLTVYVSYGDVFGE